MSLLIRRSPLAILTIAGLFTIHRPSSLYFAIVVLFTLIAYIFQEKKIPWKQIGFVIFGGCLALPLYMNQFGFLTDMIEPLTTTFGGTAKSGSFLNSRDFFFLILPYFIVLIPAVFQKMDKKEFDMVFI